MHRYRSHNCGELRDGHVGQKIRLSGWCHRIRDHGGVLFIDLRDHYGLTQCVGDPDSPAFQAAETRWGTLGSVGWYQSPKLGGEYRGGTAPGHGAGDPCLRVAA